MALTEQYYTKFEEGKFYHIYNRSIDRKPMFKNEGNYEFFLKKFNNYITPVADVYAFCLLINHFHFLIKIKKGLQSKTIKNLISVNLSLPDIIIIENTTHDIVSLRFRKFFQSYAMAFNKQQQRTGTLFQTPFKRALIDKEEYLKKLIYYIHFNPQMHKLKEDFKEWKWSSYNSFLNNKQSKLQKKEVIDWFGNIENYKNYHSEMQLLEIDKRYIMEDE